MLLPKKGKQRINCPYTPWNSHSPWNRPLEKDIHIGNHHFGGRLLLVLGRGPLPLFWKNWKNIPLTSTSQQHYGDIKSEQKLPFAPETFRVIQDLKIQREMTWLFCCPNAASVMEFRVVWAQILVLSIEKLNHLYKMSTLFTMFF